MQQSLQGVKFAGKALDNTFHIKISSFLGASEKSGMISHGTMDQ